MPDLQRLLAGGPPKQMPSAYFVLSRGFRTRATSQGSSIIGFIIALDNLPGNLYPSCQVLVMAKKSKEEKIIREFLSQIGRKGGLARAHRHTKEELSKWGRLGGRPVKKAKGNKGGNS